MQIVCTKRCFGFRKRLWNVGQVTEIEDSESIPPHFTVLGPKPVVKDVYDPMKPINIPPGEPVIPRGGMGAGIAVERLDFKTMKPIKKRSK